MRSIDALSGGWVSLVGAGPGDPDLLTRRAATRLEQADLVLYDALIDPEVLTLAGSAQRIYVGKRAGRPAMRQELINRLLIRAARRGRRVVRLKGGDPFVFGRGGEEALALVAAGIPFEVVPGVTTAVAAAELAGIPVTHRGVAAAFVVVSGHAPAAYEQVLGTLAPHTATVVVLMGLAAAADIAAVMTGHGWRTTTPAAIVRGASTDGAELWSGTLGELAGAVALSDSDRPGTIVVGEVVRVGALLGDMNVTSGQDDADEPGMTAVAR
jgi:uroporphyrin-III C-methyltransferase / precorrin-2 dehydrogenase / sirohydrochlorin ferrochelatase